MTEDANTSPVTYAGSVSCPSCLLAIPASKEIFALYLLASERLQCPGCGSELDWWDLISKALSEGFLGLQYAPIGSHSTYAEIVLAQNQTTQLD